MSHWPSRLGSDQILHLVMQKDAAFPVHSYRFTADLLWRLKLRPKPITCLKTAKDTTRRHTVGCVLLITWSVDAACRLAASPLKQTMALGGVSVNSKAFSCCHVLNDTLMWGSRWIQKALQPLLRKRTCAKRAFNSRRRSGRAWRLTNDC